MQQPDKLETLKAIIQLEDSPGFVTLCEDLKGIRTALDTIVGVKPEDVKERQGGLSIIDYVLSYVEGAKNELATPEDDGLNPLEDWS